jgi:hypothetical protein
MKEWLGSVLHDFYAKDLYLVQEFSNAMQAIKYLNQNDVDLIF